MLGGLFRSDKNKTFKPLKAHRGEKNKSLHNYAKTTLGSGDITQAIALPPGENENECERTVTSRGRRILQLESR